jgi:hypothetical protein
MKKNIAIFINSEQKGFLVSLAKVIEDEYGFSTRLILRDYDVKRFVDKVLPGRNTDIVLSDIDFSVDSVISEALRIEAKYKYKISMLISEDRALGQGYLFNVEKIPDIVRASWPHKKKLKEFVEIVKKQEIALSGCDFVIRRWPNKVTSMICREQNIKSYSFVPIKFGSRVFWSDNDYITSTNYIDRVKTQCFDTKTTLDYEIFNAGERINRSINYTLLNALKESINLLWNENKKWLRGKQKKNSYHYLGWLPSIFRQVLNYKYVKSISVKPDQLDQYKLCFFPLHLEPEVALISFSPEFNNSMEVVTWISKSLPADTLLVVKEQALSFGVRSRWYYRQLNKIGNVVLANPDVHSWDWIKKSEFVASITGTVGIEAIHMHKPVVSFGMHQIINFLPTVYYVENYKQTKNAVDKIFSETEENIDFDKSRAILESAQLESSIEFLDEENAFKSNDLNINAAKKSLELLFSEYNNLL